jgi:TRAP-type C4-dicarboxylate transport system substrate-binding protein
MAVPESSRAQTAPATPSILIKVGTLAPEGTPWHEALQEIADKWAQASGGRITLRIYGDDVTGDEPDMVRKMRLGQLQMGAFTAAGLETITTEMRALSVPLLFRSDDERDYVRSKLETRLEQALGDQGFVLLTWGDAGWVRYFATKPIPTLRALQTLKLFTSMSNSLSVQLYRDAGFRIVPLDARDVLRGLRVGLIEAVPAPASAALANRWCGLASHMLDIRIAPNVGAMVIAKATWNRIDPTLRPTLLAIARQTGSAYASRFRAHEATAIDTMVKNGLQIQELTPQAEQEWRQVADGLYPKIRGTLLPADLFDDVTRLVSEYREQQKPEPVKQPAVVQPAAAFSRLESLFPAGTAVVVETVDGPRSRAA